MFIICIIEGIYAFQTENLHFLFVFDNAGIPIYSYTFDFIHKEDSSIDVPSISSPDEILLSGALKAIFSLLTNFTGVNQTVKEIKLEQETILVTPSKLNQYAVVLLLEEPNAFYRSATLNFSRQFFEILDKIKPNERLVGVQLKQANTLIKEFFGVNKRYECNHFIRE